MASDLNPRPHADALAQAEVTPGVAPTRVRVGNCALVRALVYVCAAALGANVFAQAVTDPTQPPASLLPPRAADADSAPTPPAERGVHMIVRGPGEARAALLGETLVRVGDRARWNGENVRVLAVTDASVVISRGGKRETIELIPEAAHAVRCTRTGNPSAPC